MKTEKIELDIHKLPMIIELAVNGIKKEFIIKPNKTKTGFFINKLERY